MKDFNASEKRDIHTINTIVDSFCNEYAIQINMNIPCDREMIGNVIFGYDGLVLYCSSPSDIRLCSAEYKEVFKTQIFFMKKYETIRHMINIYRMLYTLNLERPYDIRRPSETMH